jgi:hypothetical protein
MMKFPSASAGGVVPSGNSLAVTNPGVFGSRVGGVGRAGAGGFGAGTWAIAGFTPAIRFNAAPSNAVTWVSLAIFIYIFWCGNNHVQPEKAGTITIADQS